MLKRVFLLILFVFCVSITNAQIISQYVETNVGTTPKGIEIWNNTGSTLNFSTNNLVIEKGTNGGAPSPDYTLSSGTLAAGAVIVIGTSDMEATATGNGATFYVKAFTFNGDDALVVKYGGITTDVFGTPGSDPGSAWSGNGVSTANQNIQLLGGITTGDLDGWTDPSGRFETVSTNPSGDGGLVGFGIAPTGGGSSASLEIYHAGLTEANLNSAEINLTLTDETFSDFVTGDVTLNNAPAGTWVGSVTGNNGQTNGTVTLAFNGTDFDEDVTNFSITISADGLTGYDPVTSNTLNITATLEPETLPYSQSFATSDWPSGITYDDFTIANSNNAGGSAYEAELSYQNDDPGTSNVTTPPIDTSSESNLALSWNQKVDFYEAGSGTDFIIKVQSSTDGTNFIDIWSQTVTADETALKQVSLDSGNGIGSDTFYLRWLYYQNNTNRFSYWHIDDIILQSSAAPSLIISNAGLNEGNLNDSVINITLANIQFSSSFDSGDITLNNAPTGTTINSVSGNGGEESGTVTLAFDGTDFDSNESFDITIAADGLSGSLSLDSNSLNVTAYEETITPGSASITGLDYIVSNGPSEEQSFTVTGSNLKADISVSASSNFQISTSSGSGYGISLNLTETNGSVDETIYVILQSGLSVNTYSGDITLTSTDAPSQTVSLSGEVTDGSSPQPIHTLNFESAGGYTTSITEFTDGQYDYFIRTNGDNISGESFNNIHGSYYFAAQDIDGEGATLPVYLYINDINISGYTSLEFSIYLAEDDDGSNQDWDDQDYVHINYDIDNSGSYSNLLWVESSGGTNAAPRIDTNFDGTGDGTEITDTFTEFTASIAGTGSSIDIQIVFNLDSGDEDIAIDNIVISGVLGGNIAPEITNIQQNPIEVITSSTAVTVSADVTDIDGTLSSVKLNWGTASGNLTNTLTMNQGTGDSYSVNIPAQSDGITVYYEIEATDNQSSVTTSSEYSYTVTDPLTTTIPYSENFAADISGVHTYSVLGDSKVWYHYSAGQCASINGYNSGDTEEDWMILPGVNLNSYTNEVLSFYSFYNNGDDNADNYLKLMYSTDYPGVGTPSGHTWTELSFTQPSAAQTWTYSGNLDVSGISGSSVFFAFKYYYQSGNYRLWSIDNIALGNVDNPSSFAATPSSTTQIDLTATANGSGNNIMVAYNSTNEFGIPSGTYTAGNPIAGGGTVHYIGAAGSLTNHTSLTSGQTVYYKAWSVASGNYSPGITASATTFTPTISLSVATLGGFSYDAGSGPSAEQSFTVEGSHLSEVIAVTAPVNYEISLSSGESFTTSFNLALTGGEVSTTTIYVRLKAGLSAGDYNAENISCSSSGADSKTVTCNGTVYPEGSITIAKQDFDGTSPTWSYSCDVDFFDNGWGSDGYFGIIDIASASPLNYTNFTNNILGENDLDDEGDNGTTGFATIDFADLDISSFTSVVLTFDWDVVGYNASGDDAIYEIFYDGLSQGEVYLVDGGVDSPNGEGSVSVNVPDDIDLLDLHIKIRDNGSDGFSGFDNFLVTGYAGDNALPMITNVSISPETVTSADAVTVTADVIDLDGTLIEVKLYWGTTSGYLTSNITMNPARAGYTTESPIPAQVAGVTVFYQIQATDNEDGVSTSAEDSYSVTAPLPELTISVSELSGFLYFLQNGPSKSKSFTVSGNNLSSDIVISAPTDFEVSLESETGFNGQLTLSETSGSVGETTIFARLKAGLAEGSYNGNISISSGVASETVSCSGSVSGYYTDCAGLSGATLKAVLHNIIDDHTEFIYNQEASNNILKAADQDPLNSGNVIEIYTGLSVAAIETREHVWAQSHGDFNTSDTPGRDIHNLKPCSSSMNSSRGNKDFDDVVGGTHAGYNNYYNTNAWEPRDAVKGDVARIIFYMSVRYEGDDGEIDLEVVNGVDTDNTVEGYGEHGDLESLLQWNIEDPVDEFEINRNNVIYLNQGNRNPFIDFPEYAGYIWGEETPGLVPPNAAAATNITSSSFSANWSDIAAADGYYIDVATDNGFSSILTAYYNYDAGDANTLQITGLSPDTDYFYRLRSYDSETTSDNSNIVSVTTQVEISGDAVIIISQLCDPSLNYERNRFIEITNVGIAAQGLDGWSVTAIGNGSVIFTWNLSGTITPGQSLVCGDTEATGFTPDFADNGWSNSNSTWNGKENDGARLSNPTREITDQIIAPGTLFENKSLVRNSDVTSPSDSYNPEDWTATPVDNASDANPGAHIYDNPLPITLSTFTADFQNNSATLHWTTISEINNAGYNVYRGEIDDVSSSMSINPEFIPGKGTTSEQTNYTFKDEYPVQCGMIYYYWLESVSYNGDSEKFGPIALTIPTEGDNESPDVPETFGLMPNYPNPFNPTTTIQYNLPADSQVELTVYNVKGAKIATLSRGSKEAGYHSIIWNGTDSGGNEVGSGIYFYKLKTSTYSETRSMLLIK